ncbi:glutathione S-transferase family protein [Sphingomonas sinipercae]|uniref:Glutathione S-transferase family protein n=1 Tax=Sphingomonas sinipercae TaxID=2714944 RepID=A0A6G7ZPP6_9SPHN|nr:glutathione S-transferase family protein [Sphingomonas sinipercae]QIL02913.1 glutathione S-transferase family protein [Sphingomonas sinipercae]
MANLTFYTNPMSRGQTIRWMLEEVGEPYETKLLDYGTTMKGEDYLAINPMGKVPAIVHNGKAVTEVAAICCYLADAFPKAGLAPDPKDRADYYRWIFFTSGPVEAAFTARAMNWEVPADRQAMAGFGNYDLAMDTLEQAVSGKQFIAGDRFTAADLFVGAMINFMLTFKLLDPRPAFTDYARRMTDRDAYRRASEIDGKLIAEAQARQQAEQPAQ